MRNKTETLSVLDFASNSFTNISWVVLGLWKRVHLFLKDSIKSFSQGHLGDEQQIERIPKTLKNFENPASRNAENHLKIYQVSTNSV